MAVCTGMYGLQFKEVLMMQPRAVKMEPPPPLLVNLHILFTLATSETTRPHGAQQNCMQLGGSTDPPHPFHEGTSTLVTLVMAVYLEDSVCAHVCAGTWSQVCVYVFVEVPGQLQVSSSRHRPL